MIPVRFHVSCLLGLALATSPALAQELGSTALLLPLKGRMASAATVIRDGFIAAYYQDIEQHQPSPIVRIYDNSDGHGTDLVHRAAQDGADAVVGPLDKEQVTDLALAGQPPVPVLALNHTDATAPRLYQFALAPEDEMAALVSMMRSQGLSRVRVVLQHDPASDRTRQLFESDWQAAGGTTVPAFVVDGTAKGGVVSGIRQLMNEPGTHQLDALFLATPLLSTQVRPTIAYYHAANLPLYTVASAWDAAAADITHQDQNGIHFCDAPWIVLGGWPEQDELYASHRPVSSYDRLYAFGGDAYGLIKAIYRGDAINLSGRTGHLGMSNDGRVQRGFSCVEVHNGHPQVSAAPGNVPAATPGT